MESRREKDGRKVIFVYPQESREIEIIEAKPHETVEDYFIADKSIRMDVMRVKELYALLRKHHACNDSDN